MLTSDGESQGSSPLATTCRRMPPLWSRRSGILGPFRLAPGVLGGHNSRGLLLGSPKRRHLPWCGGVLAVETPQEQQRPVCEKVTAAVPGAKDRRVCFWQICSLCAGPWPPVQPEAETGEGRFRSPGCGGLGGCLERASCWNTGTRKFHGS